MISKEKGIELKGLAILIIMIGHLVMLNKTSWNYDIRYFAAFSVSIFLILSGYGLAKSYTANMLNGFFRKRLKSVVWPYFLATMMISVWFGVLINDPIKAIRSATLTGPNNPVDGTMWFIYFICIWYLLFYITYATITRPSVRLLILLIFAVCINQLNLPYFESGLQFQFKLHSYSFVVGVLIANISNYLNYTVRCIVSLISLIAFSVSLYFTLTDFTIFNYTFSALFFGVSLIFTFSVLKLRIPPLIFIGGISYEMYLFEGVLMNLNYSDFQTINAIVFIYLTISIAFTFKKVHSVL